MSDYYGKRQKNPQNNLISGRYVDPDYIDVLNI